MGQNQQLNWSHSSRGLILYLIVAQSFINELGDMFLHNHEQTHTVIYIKLITLNSH